MFLMIRSLCFGRHAKDSLHSWNSMFACAHKLGPFQFFLSGLKLLESSTFTWVSRRASWKADYFKSSLGCPGGYFASTFLCARWLKVCAGWQPFLLSGVWWFTEVAHVWLGRKTAPSRNQEDPYCWGGSVYFLRSGIGRGWQSFQFLPHGHWD